MPITMQTYRALSLEDPDHQWELFHGKLVEKPSMSVSHNRTMARLAHQLSAQLDVNKYEVRTNTGRLRYTDETYFIPDIHIVPVALVIESGEASEWLEVFDAAMPFVAEVWSPSTGDYDVDRKIPEYQRRGDAEIWRLHPYERSVTMFHRQDDGTYAQSVIFSGVIALLAVPMVMVNVDEIFAFGVPESESA